MHFLFWAWCSRRTYYGSTIASEVMACLPEDVSEEEILEGLKAVKTGDASFHHGIGMAPSSFGVAVNLDIQRKRDEMKPGHQLSLDLPES